MKEQDPEGIAEAIRRSEFSAIFDRTVGPKRRSSVKEETLPLVFLHGMVCLTHP